MLHVKGKIKIRNMLKTDRSRDNKITTDSPITAPNVSVNKVQSSLKLIQVHTAVTNTKSEIPITWLYQTRIPPPNQRTA